MVAPPPSRLSGAALIDALALEPHVEGGYFHRTYTAPLATDQTSDGRRRPAASSIFYLLTSDSPVGYLHSNRSDILHFWHAGDPLRYTLLSPAGELSTVTLGPDLSAGQQLQLLVPGGTWKASALANPSAEAYGLISEVVCPGFDFADHRMADAQWIEAHYPGHWPTLAPLIRH